MHLEVRHLKLIMAVTQENSLTRAGQRLHLTQSALSHQLRDIEDRLGVRLFYRLNKRMIPTEAGEKLLRSARLVIGELERVEEDLRRLASGQAGALRISTECYTCYHWLPAVLKTFNRQYPQVEVRIVVEATRRPLEALLNGKLDLAIVSRPVTDNRLHYEPLFEDELVVILSPDHPLTRRRYVRPEDFANENLIIYTMPDKESSLLQDILYPAEVTPRTISRVQLSEAIIEMVKAGLGVGVMARWAVAPHLDSGALAALPLTAKGYRRKWSAAMLAAAGVPAYLPEFARLIARNAMPASQNASTTSGKNGRRRKYPAPRT